MVSSRWLYWSLRPEGIGSSRASLNARSRFVASTLAPELAPFGARSTPSSIFCASVGNMNMSAD